MASSLPPYLRIDPDEAMDQLGSFASTEGFAEIAAACSRGRADLTSRGLGAEGDRSLRKFSTWEICRYLIPVAQGHFRRVLKSNPELPQGESARAGSAKWFTFDEVLTLRAHFGREGSKAKKYLPFRPEGLPAKILAVANFKAGVGKTSTAAHLAMSAALDGYRVLTIDLDSQGSLTSILGGRVADEWQTVFPLLAHHHGEYMRAQNQRAVDRGEAPQPLDETLVAAMKLKSEDLIQHTRWPNIDLIGAQLNLNWAEFQIPAWRLQARGWKLWNALGDRLAADGVLDRYDLVILDTPPALGYLSINALSAANILLVPLGASLPELDATARFFDMLATTFRSIEEGENVSARALGQPETSFEWDAVRAVITRYDGTSQAELAALMQTYLGGALSPHRQETTALIGQPGQQAQAVYEADYRDFNRETYARGRETFDATYAAVKALVVGAWRRDQARAAGTE